MNQDLVLSTDFYPTLGGAHHWLYEVYRRWPRPVKALVQDYSSDPALMLAQAEFDREQNGSLRVKRAKMNLGDINMMSPGYLMSLRRVVRDLKALDDGRDSTIHCLRAFPEGLAGLIYKFQNLKRRQLVTYAHGEEILVAATSRQLKIIAREVYRWSDFVIANSQSTKALVHDLCPDARVVVIHPGVDAPAFDLSEDRRRAHRAGWGWPDGTTILTTVARMEPRKNHANVLRAMASLRSEGYPLAYVIGSTGEERPRLESLARELGIAEWVRFTGRLSEEDRVSTFAAADIHIMPSVQVGQMIEGFGIVFMEAAAATRPSISGMVGGQQEAVMHQKTGLVVDGEDIAQVKKAIENLLSPDLRVKMGAAGRIWALQHDWGRVAGRTHTAIQEYGL